MRVLLFVALAAVAGCGGNTTAATTDGGPVDVLPDGPAPALDAGPPPGLCAPDGWCWVTPRPHGYALNAVWASGPADVWAVGEGGAMLHYNGTGWAALTPLTTAALTGIWGSGPGDVWAVGVAGIRMGVANGADPVAALRATEGVVFHYDGVA